MHLHAVCQYLTNYFKCSIYTVNAFCSHLHMTVMSYAFPLLFCTHFFQVVLSETYQECLALVGRSGGAERAAIARKLHLPPHLQESPDLRRLLRNAYRKYNASIMPDIFKIILLRSVLSSIHSAIRMQDCHYILAPICSCAQRSLFSRFVRRQVDNRWFRGISSQASDDPLRQ